MKTGRGTVGPRDAGAERANENRSLLDVSPRMIRAMPEYKAPHPRAHLADKGAVLKAIEDEL
jgi:hypothetical protein